MKCICSKYFGGKLDSKISSALQLREFDARRGVGLTHSKRRLKSVHKGASALMHCVFVCPAQKTPAGSGPSWK